MAPTNTVQRVIAHNSTKVVARDDGMRTGGERRIGSIENVLVRNVYVRQCFST